MIQYKAVLGKNLDEFMKFCKETKALVNPNTLRAVTNNIVYICVTNELEVEKMEATDLIELPNAQKRLNYNRIKFLVNRRIEENRAAVKFDRQAERVVERAEAKERKANRPDETGS